MALLLATLARFADGHAAVTQPRPRNAIDAVLTPWSEGVPNPYNTGYKGHGFDPWCPFPSDTGDSDNHNVSGANGQACFWFSNGCTIGCNGAPCDGTTRAPLPNNRSVRHKSPACEKPDPTAATNCDGRTRTVNAAAPCGSDADVYYYSPFRAPGAAPVLDACGVAGGKHGGPGDGEAVYTNTSFAKQGDLGSKLPQGKLANQPVWTAGAAVEVAWTIQTNHGGGYQYRLCPASGSLNEECFREMPLRFVGQQRLRWGGRGGEEIAFDGVYLDQGTVPSGSMWAINPVPINWHLDVIGAGSLKPRCDERADCNPACQEWPCDNGCRCSGRKGPYDLEIVDMVEIPDVPEGEYVLGWRWDCEESNQVWSSCSDVLIKKPPGMLKFE